MLHRLRSLFTRSEPEPSGPPFTLKNDQRADLIRLNVALEGPGTVWIRGVELLRTPLG